MPSLLTTFFSLLILIFKYINRSVKATKSPSNHNNEYFRPLNLNTYTKYFSLTYDPDYTKVKAESVNCFMPSPLKTMIDPFHFFENRHFFSSDSLASPLAFLYSSVFLMKPKSIRLYAMSIMVVFWSLGWNPNSALIYGKTTNKMLSRLGL